MELALPVKLLLTAVFVVGSVAVLPLPGRGRPVGATDRISHALHVVMGGALIVMTWRAEPLPHLWLLTLMFGCCAIWFGLTSLGRAAGARYGLHHVVMCGAMIWMLDVTPDAPGHKAMEPMSPSTTMVVVAGLLAIYFAVAAFAVAAVVWARSIRREGGATADATAAVGLGHAAMSAGMATMLVAMAA